MVVISEPLELTVWNLVWR